MNKKQLAILERAWEAEIACVLKEQSLPIIQTKAALREGADKC